MLIGGRTVLAQIAQATRSLELVSPLVLGTSVEEALARAPARRKRLLTRYSPLDILAGYTDLTLLARLRRKGVEIRFLDDIGARLYLVDARWGYIGSATLTRQGLDDSGADLGVAVDDEAGLQKLYAGFAQLWTRAVELTPAQWALALHASDDALGFLEAARRDVSEAERALTRFVDVPRVRVARRPPVVAPEPERHTPEFVRRRVEAWSGSTQLAREVAALFAWAIETIPNASDSASWTVLLGEHHLRLKLGLPEILAVEEGEDGGVLSLVGMGGLLPEADRERLRLFGATIAPSTYASATGSTREALRIGNLPLARLGDVLPLLKPGFEQYVRLHRELTLSQRGFAPSVLEFLEDELDRPVPWPRGKARSRPPEPMAQVLFDPAQRDALEQLDEPPPPRPGPESRN